MERIVAADGETFKSVDRTMPDDLAFESFSQIASNHKVAKPPGLHLVHSSQEELFL